MGVTCSSCTKEEIDAEDQKSEEPLVRRDSAPEYEDAANLASDRTPLASRVHPARKSVKLDEEHPLGNTIDRMSSRPEPVILDGKGKVLNVLHLTDFEQFDGPGMYTVWVSYDEAISYNNFKLGTSPVRCNVVKGREQVEIHQDIQLPEDTRALRVGVFRDQKLAGIAKFRPEHPLLKVLNVPWIAVTDPDSSDAASEPKNLGFLRVRCDVPEGSDFPMFGISDEEYDSEEEEDTEYKGGH
eukprot:GEMP01050133.1.p1 GENE.GEMP01050133.1~~GEMP01050133.1.p1  ORF type:complete len:241 (+),score=58.49 GEMP01050133.1:163-885(+)